MNMNIEDLQKTLLNTRNQLDVAEINLMESKSELKLTILEF